MKAPRILVAQMAPALGDVEENLRRHLECLDSPAGRRADLVVFPELSLTGYFVKDLAPDLALVEGDSRLAPLLERSMRSDIVIGAVCRTTEEQVRLSSLYLSAGRVLHRHDKVYLPNYGLFEDARYFESGQAFRAFDTGIGRVGMLICEDAWHPSAAGLLVADGAALLLVTAASPIRGLEGDQPAAARAWGELNRTLARMHGVHLVFANRVGFEDGTCFWGGSAVVDPRGQVVAEAPLIEAALLEMELDPWALRRARTDTPLGRDERLELTLAELARIRANRMAAT
ncbi:MAG: nitrilase-related carbon-nitrogen hydrolase [Candidatus Sericytochromatia bacterium]|nr:nitrilase-related carbon-nitrogen hydrolase [Candidatus Sericytochromatia bacterium]